MSFTDDLLKTCINTYLVTPPFTKTEWSIIINAFDNYTDAFEANVLGKTAPISELEKKHKMEEFREFLEGESDAIDFTQDPIFDPEVFEDYLLKPVDHARRNRPLSKQVPTQPIVPQPRQKRPTVESIHVPDVLKPAKAAPIPAVEKPVVQTSQPLHQPQQPEVKATVKQTVTPTSVVKPALEPQPKLPTEQPRKQPVEQPIAQSIQQTTQSETPEPTPQQPVALEQETQPEPKDRPLPSLQNATSKKADQLDALYKEFFSQFERDLTNALCYERDLKHYNVVVENIPIEKLGLHKFNVDILTALADSFVSKHEKTFEDPNEFKVYLNLDPSTDEYLINFDKLEALVKSDLLEIAESILT